MRTEITGDTYEYAGNLAALLHFKFPGAVVDLHYLGRLNENGFA